MKKNWKETENSLFTCDMVYLIENPNNFGDILLELIIEFNTVSGYKS